MTKDRRMLLGQEFRALGIKNAYFQPPKTVMLRYPCVIYRLDNIDKTNADDKAYVTTNRYLVTYVTEDPDDEMIFELIKHFQMISWSGSFTSDNLNHYNYNLYF